MLYFRSKNLAQPSGTRSYGGDSFKTTTKDKNFDEEEGILGARTANQVWIETLVYNVSFILMFMICFVS